MKNVVSPIKGVYMKGGTLTDQDIKVDGYGQLDRPWSAKGSLHIHEAVPLALR